MLSSRPELTADVLIAGAAPTDEATTAVSGRWRHFEVKGTSAITIDDRFIVNCR